MNKPKIIEWTSTFNGYRRSAGVIGPHIANLIERSGDDLDHPAIIVDDAKRAGSPLHEHFEWRDGVAADRWRLQQARHIVGHLRVVIDKGRGKETVTVPAFVNIIIETVEPAKNTRKGVCSNTKQGYATATRALTTPAFRKYLIGEALRAAETYKVKYALLGDEELAEIFSAIDMTLEKHR